MPKIRKYTNGSGYFIRSNIGGNYVTLQLTPAAEGLFTELDYSHGDTVSWDLLSPLCEIGHTYTNQSGKDLSSRVDDVDNSLDTATLTEEEKRRLEEFLSRSTRLRNSEDDSSEPLDKDYNQSDIDEIIGPQVKSFLERWSPSEEAHQTTLNRIARAEDSEGIVKSINQHTVHHPIQPDRFQVSSRGIPTYSFETDGIPWIVHHFEPVHKTNVDASLFVEIQPGTGKSQSITIGPDQSEWHTSKTRFSSEQVDKLIAVIPDILYYYHNYEHKPSGSPYDIISNPSGDLRSDDKDRIEAIDNIRGIDRKEYGPVLGEIISKGEYGYGRVRAHTGHTFLYESAEFEENEISIGDFVSFSVCKTDNGIEACSIRPIYLDISPREFLVRWPSWQDCSIEEVQSLINGENNKDSDLSEESLPLFQFTEIKGSGTVVEADIDRAALWLLEVGDGSVDELLDEAVRDVLKDSVDGETSRYQTPISRQRVQIEMPDNIISMIDFVVETTVMYENRSELITAALQSYVDANKEVELTISIPKGYYNVIEYMANDQNTTTDELIISVLEESFQNSNCN